MLRVALTGGIATGKSYVRSRIEAAGVPTIDSDRVVHRLLSSGSPVTAAVGARFGPGVLTPSGAVDRPALGRVVFADARARHDLEAIVHPAVYAEIAAWMSEASRLRWPWVLADIPLLYETGRQGDFDRVIVAACDPDTQLRRVILRDGLSETDARARLAAQWAILRKVRLADHVITTDGSLEETNRQVDAVVESLSRSP
jgi:dephospho-CoA kinase